VKLSNLEFIKLLPQFMKNDDAVRGLAAGIDSIIPQLAAELEKLSTWDCIDKLSEAELDDLAWELNILWYDTSAPIDVKRNIVLDSDQVYKKLGTKWAVERVTNTYFGDGHVSEWWEYGGEPGHFQIVSSNPSLNSNKFNEFVSLLNKVKRASAKLDAIVIALSGELPLYAGVAVHEIGREQYAIGATDGTYRL
jgi:phage tail P2-like protein